ncbi:flagellar basal body rod protein FlgB [Brucella pituitosa]|jgi:flagellar basal-body rod protein FlgB|uniref:Flagellar basal body rod protein FlgB n=1 Tax=Brucella pituitosa TaxID=571256 RepID=A0A643EVM5_9HYPH|nr:MULTISPECIES: flagellar basal body rod protein FlgB [Brucella]PQZ48049.1 flagellar basal body rod protein FlgB [Ochrobactrum sp. MYb19]PRA49536.1 flagellar basal body rod protein FlgB [Ochrobactrum sp. MYb68]PRA64234.1 flagellar basal body rod protein FlgB [Ochrobactrum sp. MYb18]PRA75257.1 flagellar basal body rod protein FlgB [Brucella thiophenivorans]PRA84018.1 flagellar basal body rod protein FlgB [Ochrobactrum sp. MYb29]PRA89533.1 flagellar basal body rod protein FlgB [Ochrobactrum sp
MSSIHLFDLAARQAQWLSVRQATVAGNVANANTPDFRARDVQPFADVLDKTQLTMAATSPQHLEAEANGIAGARLRPEDITEQTHSGNTVDVEREMMKAGEVAREYSLNTSIVKAFHRMMLSVARG